MVAFSVTANDAFENRAELIAVINDWMDREDLTGAAPQMIALAEDEIRLAVEPFFLEVSTSLISDASGRANLPADMKRLSRVLYDNEPVYQRGATAIARMNDDTTRPSAYTLEQGAIRLWPAAAHTVQVLYQPKLARLTEANPTNNLLNDFPSLYFYGAMVFAAGYVADDDRAVRFRALFDNIKAQVSDYYKMQRQGGPMVARVAFVP